MNFQLIDGCWAFGSFDNTSDGKRAFGFANMNQDSVLSKSSWIEFIPFSFLYAADILTSEAFANNPGLELVSGLAS